MLKRHKDEGSPPFIVISTCLPWLSSAGLRPFGKKIGFNAHNALLWLNREEVSYYCWLGTRSNSMSMSSRHNSFHWLHSTLNIYSNLFTLVEEKCINETLKEWKKVDLPDDNDEHDPFPFRAPHVPFPNPSQNLQSQSKPWWINWRDYHLFIWTFVL